LLATPLDRRKAPSNGGALQVLTPPPFAQARKGGGKVRITTPPSRHMMIIP